MKAHWKSNPDPRTPEMTFHRRAARPPGTLRALAQSARAACTWFLLVACLSGFLAAHLLSSRPIVARGATTGLPGFGWSVYLCKGQYLADARTAACMLKYLLEPEPGVLQTNSVVQG